MTTLQDLQNQYNELTAKIAELQKQQEEIAKAIVIEQSKIEETKTADNKAEEEKKAYNEAYADYLKKVDQSDDWFAFEATEYVNFSGGLIITYDKKVYYSDHPSVKAGEKLNTRRLSAAGYSKKKTPWNGARKKIKD
jgi:predicted nuclease with TOPRIM domain